MQIAEVIDPYHALVDVTRCDLWTLISVHPGAPTGSVAQEIAHRLHSDEVEPWARPWVPPGGALDYGALLHDPIGTLTRMQPHLLTVPAIPCVIPHAMRVPGVDYSPTR